MTASLAEHPTRKKILFSLRRNGNMSVDDLSREVNISPMGVRQHLFLLEKSGVVEYFAKKQGVGRPCFFYRLTKQADDLFPKTYQRFALEVLEDIERYDGADRLNHIFERRKERIAGEFRDALSGRKKLNDRVTAIEKKMENDGYLVEVEDKADAYVINLFNCPISNISMKYHDACRYELSLFQEFLGPQVVRNQCMADGDHACSYDVPKGAEKPPEHEA